MITRRPSDQRGHFDLGWLDTRHSFSFGDYHDPAHMGWGPLRVLNQDIVAPAQGFGMHPHRDMEILSIVLSGALEHRDSLGSHGVIRPGEVQRITAGSGVRHSEFNHSQSQPVHFLQIWIKPRAQGLPPSYEQRSFPTAASSGAGAGWILLASPDGRDGSLVIQQDARVLRAPLATGGTLHHALGQGRRAWVQVIAGSVRAGEVALEAGDGAAILDEPGLTITAQSDADVLLLDLP